MNEAKAHKPSTLGRPTFAIATVIAWLALVWIADRVGIPSTEPGTVTDYAGQHAPAWEVVSIDQLPADGDVRERLVLFDPSPLFFPAWADSGGGEASSAKPSVAAQNFPPAFRYPDTAPAGRFFRPAEAVSAVSTVQAMASARWFEGLARIADLPVEVAKPLRGAQVDIYVAGESERMRSYQIEDRELVSTGIWQPAEFMLLISDAGAFASPVLVRGSGVDDVDERIRSIVVSELLPTLLLRPGLYRLEVGP